MPLLKIARMGHPVLRSVASPVDDPTDAALRRLAEDMVATMWDAGGIGLAAPQVHEALRLIVFTPVDERPDGPSERGKVTILVNPEITILDPEPVEGLEGCLSIPQLRGLVPRPRRIGYAGWDLAGKRIEREATGLHARVVQHEVDHLDGILYLDRMPDLTQLAFESELHHMVGEPQVPEEPEG